jgi:protein-disulfide isomerase
MVKRDKSLDLARNKGNIAIALAIIASGLIIGFAVVSDNGNTSAGVANVAGAPQEGPDGSANPMNIRPVDENDHIRGDINAPVKLVEFSDFECPFCTRLHPTLKTLVEESNGQVAWVFRHFPLTQIHSGAKELAEASECVASVGGNEKFWEFSDIAFERLSLAGENNIREAVNEIGLNADDVMSCINSNETAGLVNEDLQDATNSAGRGTPYTVIIGPDGNTFALSGAQPIQAFNQIISQILN